MQLMKEFTWIYDSKGLKAHHRPSREAGGMSGAAAESSHLEPQTHSRERPRESREGKALSAQCPVPVASFF